MDASKVHLLTQADFVLSKCGRPMPPVGSVVYLYKGFMIQAVLPVTSGQTFYKEITGDTIWCWRSISTALSGSPPAIMAQVQSPDGKVLFNGLLDLTVIAGYGSSRYALSREIECPPGTKIQLALDDNYLAAGAVQPVAMLMGGAYAYFLRNGSRNLWNSGVWTTIPESIVEPMVSPEQSASLLPRVFGTVNQNIMAPCWMMGEGPSTPAGLEDNTYTYGNGVSNLASVTLGGNLTTKASIQIDADSDFLVRRFLFDVIPAAGVTAGSFLIKIRAGSGYVFTDDYFDAAKYIGSAYLLKPWEVRAADSIIFEMTLVDGAGAGAISIECFAEGVRRKRRAA
jgi:hypothetical protein